MFGWLLAGVVLMLLALGFLISLFMAIFYMVQHALDHRPRRGDQPDTSMQHERLVRLTDAERTAEIVLLERKVFNR